MAQPAGLLVSGYQGYFSRGKGVADHQLHLAPKLRISDSIHPLSHVPSWRAQALIYLY